MEQHRSTGVHRYSMNNRSIEHDQLAIESLIHLVSGSNAIASLLATPSHLECLYVGHAAAEGYGNVSIESITVEHTASGSWKVSTSTSLTNRIDSDRIITSSCGACNVDGLDELIEQLPMHGTLHNEFSHSESYQALQQMRSLQSGFHATGGMHAAALWTPEKGVMCVAEDIGRHNAVDKAIGMGLVQGGIPPHSHLLLSGRCGWDLVAKAARSGVGTIVCIGACSTLAAKTARNLGIRIFSFMKPDGCVGIGHL
ncbi:MAG: hypothetical protein CMA63_02355 [Euryarchaeota archaeon]|nr:hypothetical protein [Euryarchaeota archaeon]|tara:strand:- start:8751 stop:9515 length:765 start_codon:yes stop_codon:yes gene_type:complete